MQLISLVYTNRPLAFNEMGRFKKYVFYSIYSLKELIKKKYSNLNESFKAKK